MTVSVRSWPQMAADLREEASNDRCDTRHLVAEAAVLLADVAAALPDCPTCGGDWVNYHDPADPPNAEGMVCPAGCDHGKVTVAQLAAVFARVWKFADEERHQHGGEYGEGWRACIDHLRAVKP